MSKYSEVRCNFLDERDHFWRVDAWETDDEWEEGVVVALIDDWTGRVVYIDNAAIEDDLVQEVIAEKMHKIEENKFLLKDEQGTLTAYYRTAAGRLVAQFEDENGLGSDAIYVGVHPVDHEDSYLDLTGVRIETDKEYIGEDPYALRLYVFADPSSEDPTNGYAYGVSGDTVYKAQIDEALAEYEDNNDAN